MLSPAAKFFPQDKMTVVFGTLTIHCAYWVEWGDDHWHVQIERIEERVGGETPSFERVSEVVREALRGAASRRIFVEEAKPIQSLQRNAGAWPAILDGAPPLHRASSFEKTAGAQPPRG